MVAERAVDRLWRADDARLQEASLRRGAALALTKGVAVDEGSSLLVYFYDRKPADVHY